MEPSKQKSSGGSFAALMVGLGIILSRFAGLYRTHLFARFLGNSDAAGAYSAAMKIPNFLQNLFGEGIMSASFIPVYARLKAEGRDEEAKEVAESIGTLLALAVTVIAALGVLSSRALIDILAPGFEGATRELTIRIVQILFPGTAMLVLSAWCLAILNSHKQFLLSYAAPVLWNFAIIAALLIYGPSHSVEDSQKMDLAILITWGTLIGCALQFLVQLPKAVRFSRVHRPRLRRKSTHTQLVMKNFLPVVLSRGVVQISAWIDGSIASLLSPAMVAAMSYAQQLYLLPISLFAMSISAAQLPEMSSVVGSDEEINRTIRAKLVTSLERVSYFVIPSVLAFLVLGDVVTAAIFRSGQFGQNDVAIVWAILAGSTCGLLAQTQGRLLSSTFYAIKDTRTPVRFAVVRVTITAVLGFILAIPVRKYFQLSDVVGAASLTASAGFAGWVEFLCLRRSLQRLIGPFSMNTPYLLKLWAIALSGGALAFGLKLLLPAWPSVIVGALVLGLYGAFYIGLTIILGLGEGRPLLAKILRKLKLRK